MDPYAQSMDPRSHRDSFMDLLNSQQETQINESCSSSMELGSSQVPYFGTQMSEDSEELEEIHVGRKERSKWTPTEDIVLCSAWLNTSKDAVVGNQQKGAAFWKRIAAYFNSSPKLTGLKKRESSHCKQRWHRINESVGKFVGCYEAAQRQKSSGYNDSDVLKVAYDIFFTDHKVKFNLEHAWIELRNDQKWCASSTCKGDGSSKKRKVNEQPENQEARPEGVKAAKAKVKAAKAKGTAASETPSKADFQNMLTVKEKDITIKDRLSKVRLLECLIAKKEPLSETKVTLKDKLINDMLSN